MSNLTRDAAGHILQRVGASAMLYYPEIHADELSFNFNNEISWCLEDVDDIDADDEPILRDAIARAIIDPTAHRSKLNEVLGILTADQPG